MNTHASALTSTASIVARVADEFVEQLSRGESPEISAYARRYPRVASVLSQVLPAVKMIHELDAAIDGPSASAAEIGMLDDYRILREIGRGGMGVVYEAEQVSLGRRVALKVLPATAGIDARQLARFQIEAQVAAALHHPYIVPIFAVGCAQGVHYYAMQLIEGHSLAEVLRGSSRRTEDDATDEMEAVERPRFCLSPREAARLAMRAAEGLEHAHALGVLHRDIKPGNLLVDDQGHLWITDFGLARFRGSGDLTQSGDLLGTLRYMSPEQAVGGRLLDPRTDVYSLGATLYELLAARPAFQSGDRQELLRLISDAEPVALRKLDPTIPRDLETIVSKAMAKEPSLRYTTASELAADLGRFLDDRPILARRPGLAERAARWSRRHRGATAAAAAIVMLIAVASTCGMARLWSEQQKTRAALDSAQQARRHERQALLFTFAASDQIAERALLLIATPKPKRPSAEEETDKEFCKKALAYYQEIASRYSGDGEMRSIAAAAHHRIGFIRTILKDAGALEALRKSIALYEVLVAESPASEQYLFQLGSAHADLVLLFRTNGAIASHLDCFEQLVALRQRLTDRFPANLCYAISLAYNQTELAELLAAAGRSDEAGIARRRLEHCFRKICVLEPGDPRICNNLAWLLVSRRTEPADGAAQAVELAQRAVTQDHDNGAYWNTLGIAHFRDGDSKAAASALEQSMRLRCGGDAHDWLFLAMVRSQQGDRADARRLYERSLAWIRANAPENEELLRFRAEAARLLKIECPPLCEGGENTLVTK
jgi:serine/threonine protein kinase